MLLSLQACRRHYPGGTNVSLSFTGFAFRLGDALAAAFPITSLGRLPH